MKKFKSLYDLKSLLPENFQSENDTQKESKQINQNLEAHYSIKGRSGKPVTIIKGFKGNLSEIIFHHLCHIEIKNSIPILRRFALEK